MGVKRERGIVMSKTTIRLYACLLVLQYVYIYLQQYGWWNTKKGNFWKGETLCPHVNSIMPFYHSCVMVQKTARLSNQQTSKYVGWLPLWSNDSNDSKRERAITKRQNGEFWESLFPKILPFTFSTKRKREKIICGMNKHLLWFSQKTSQLQPTQPFCPEQDFQQRWGKLSEHIKSAITPAYGLPLMLIVRRLFTKRNTK